MMQHSMSSIGQTARKVRKKLGLTQSDLALTAGTGLRFIVELEQGKPSCEAGKVLQVLQVLGIRLELHPPEAQSYD